MVGVHPNSVRAQAACDPRDLAKLEAAQAAATGAVEAKAWQAATGQLPEAVVYRGEVTGTINTYLPEMAELWLKSHMPETYAREQRSRAEHLHLHAVVDLSDEQLAEVVTKKANGIK